MGFPDGSVGKEPACNAGDADLIPGWERFPWGGHGNPLQFSCLENPMDRGAWQATVHGVAKSRTWLKWLSTHLKGETGEGNGTPLQYSCLENPMDGGAWWAAVHGVAEGRTRLSNFTFTFHFHALEKEMATHSSVLAWRIPGTGEPGGLPSNGSHRVGHDWGDLAAVAAKGETKRGGQGSSAGKIKAGSPLTSSKWQEPKLELKLKPPSLQPVLCFAIMHSPSLLWLLLSQPLCHPTTGHLAANCRFWSQSFVKDALQMLSHENILPGKCTHVIRTQLSEFSLNEPSRVMRPVTEVKKWSMRLMRGSWGWCQCSTTWLWW